MQKSSGNMSLLLQLLAFSTLTFAQNLSNIRLRGGNDLYEGNVQVEVNGVWGYVCDDGFGFEAADLVCSELGFGPAVTFTRNNKFEPHSAEKHAGEIKFWFDGFQCSGASSIKNCSYDESVDCFPTEIAGVVCSRNGTRCADDEFACSDGDGCVPKSYVCDQDLDCFDGSDDAPELCQDVGVVRMGKSNTPLDVPGMTAGIVMVKGDGIWGTICDSGVTRNDAKVLCRSLGYIGGWALPFYVRYLGRESAGIVASSPECQGHEQWIGQCPRISWSSGSCFGPSDKFDLSILCSEDVAVRVAGGKPEQGGRLEVKFGTSVWASVCDTGFDDLDAKVVCRMLGFEGDALAIQPTFPSGVVLNVVLDCNGNESRIEDCRLRLLNGTCNTGATLSCSNRKTSEALLRASLPSECGLTASSSDLYIGGLAKVQGSRVASRFDNPWAVTFLLPRETLLYGSVSCGGSIITEDHVVTSAVCFKKFDKHSYLIRAGDYNTAFVEGSFEQEFEIDKVWIHERYQEVDQYDNSIALVKVQRKNGHGFRFTEYVRPICLPFSDSSYEDLGTCTIFGFGSRALREQQPQKPREANVFFTGDLTCEEKFGGSSTYTSTHACVTSASEQTNPCHGDNGTPVTCTLNARKTLFGVAAEQTACGFRGPFKAIRVAKYVRWILEKIAAH